MLTVLFGENAAGKTGYVRVLKRLAWVRSAQAIVGNVHNAAAAKPHATLDYQLSGAAKTYPSGGPRSAAGQVAAVASPACDASFRPSSRRAWSRC